MARKCLLLRCLNTIRLPFVSGTEKTLTPSVLPFPACGELSSYLGINPWRRSSLLSRVNVGLLALSF